MIGGSAYGIRTRDLRLERALSSPHLVSSSTQENHVQAAAMMQTPNGYYRGPASSVTFSVTEFVAVSLAVPFYVVSSLCQALLYPGTLYSNCSGLLWAYVSEGRDHGIHGRWRTVRHPE